MLLSPSSVSDAGVGHQHLQPLPPQMQLICNTQQTVTEDGWMRARRKLEACSIESAIRALLHFVELSIHPIRILCRCRRRSSLSSVLSTNKTRPPRSRKSITNRTDATDILLGYLALKQFL